jgi:hypothetical protein
MTMGTKNLRHFIIGGLSLAGFCSLALIPFSNCSRNPQNASVPKTAYLSPSEKEEAIKLEFKGRIPITFCQTSDAYGCMKRVYSGKVKSEELPGKQECAEVSDQLKLCPLTQTFHFNSLAAEENCNGCQETYEYLEYSCHLKIPNIENIYPIVAIKPSMGQSLSELYELCVTLAEEIE